MRRIPAFTLALALACGGAAFAAQDHHDASTGNGTATLHRMGAELRSALHRLGDATRHALHRADAAAHRTTSRSDDERRHS